MLGKLGALGLTAWLASGVAMIAIAAVYGDPPHWAFWVAFGVFLAPTLPLIVVGYSVFIHSLWKGDF